jgi:hypothetical protein
VFKPKQRNLLFVILFSLVFVVACDESSALVSPEVEDTAAELAAIVPEDALERIQELESAFDSYRWQSNMVLVADDENIAQQNLSLTWTSDDTRPAQQVEFVFEGGLSADELVASNLTLTATEDTVYLVPEGEGCTAIPAELGLSLAETLHDAFDPTRIALEPGSLRRVLPNQEINGVRVAQFVFDEAVMGDLGEAGFESASGTIYIAIDGQHIVRMELEADGEINFDLFAEEPNLQNGKLMITYDVVETDAEYAIDIPAECDATLELP